MEELNMSKSSENNLAAITPFLLLCAFPPRQSKKILPLFIISHVYISAFQKNPPNLLEENPLIYVLFVTLYKDNKKSPSKKNFSDPKKEIHFPFLFSSLL